MLPPGRAADTLVFVKGGRGCDWDVVWNFQAGRDQIGLDGFGRQDVSYRVSNDGVHLRLGDDTVVLKGLTTWADSNLVPI